MRTEYKGNNMRTQDEARKALQAYAWPGGYPMCYLARDGWRDEDTGKLDFNKHDQSENMCCATCAADVDKWPDLIIVVEYVHWEGPPEQCEYCSESTESAYGTYSENLGELTYENHGHYAIPVNGFSTDVVQENIDGLRERGAHHIRWTRNDNASTLVDANELNGLGE